MRERPGFYEDLDLALAELWQRLLRGAADRRSAFHLLAVATADAAGAPRLRNVVLRAADPRLWQLRFHTDARSAKAAELAANPAVALLGYDPGAKIQIRLEGTAALHGQDAVADAAWAGSAPSSRACYGTQPAPGSAIPAGAALPLPGPGAVEAGRPQFRAVVVTARRIEWLYLAAEGHRRAEFVRGEDGAVRAGWLAP